MKFIITLVALLVLSSCDKGSDSENTTPPPPNQQQGTPPPQPVPQPQPVPAPVVLPQVAFGFDEYVMESGYEVNMELVLSKASDVPVVVDVSLIDGTAAHGPDYSGFEGAENETQLTVVFAPQQTRVDLPVIHIPNDGNCNVEFAAKATVQQATIVKDTTRIVIPCL